MAKGKKSRKKNMKINFTHVIIVAMIIGFLFYLVHAGIIPMNIITQTETIIVEKPITVVPEAEDCTDYHLSQEYRKAFGESSIDTFKNSCNNIGGIWRERSDEISCYWDPNSPLGTIDCNQAGIRILGNFCEDDLLARWVCDEDIAYAGCLCQTSVPGIWETDEQEEQNGGLDDLYDYCAWHTHIAYGEVCAGPCENPLADCQVMPGTDWCDCFTEEEIEDYTTLKYIVFVTSNSWNGAMGGLSGADAKCSTAAYYAGLGTNFKAIMSDDTYDAIDRMPTIDGQFVMVNSVKIADNKADMFDGSLDAVFNVDEHGNVVTGKAWTGTECDGTKVSTTYDYYCHDWGWVSADGTYGNIAGAGCSWINQATQTCDNGAHLYCVGS